jgi:multiple sugar transport system permease protein
VYTLNSFFREMPWDLEEAARIDGCTPAQAFRIVILPLAAPAVFTTAILAFIASWNEYLLVSVLGNDQIGTVTRAIANFTGSIPHVQPYTTIMAAGTIVTIPLIILVLLFQRRIVAGLTAGGVKG